MTREGQTTQGRKSRTTGSLRHGGRPPRRDPDRREWNLGATQRRLRRDRHARRRDRVRRGVKGILDDNAAPVGVLSGHHRETPILVPAGGIKTVHRIVEGFFLDRESRPQNKHGLEKAQGIGVIPGQLLRLELLDPARQGVREQPETAVTRLLVSAVARHQQVLGRQMAIVTEWASRHDR